MLLQLREYIRKEKLVSMQQLMREFSVDGEALLPMLQCWMKKGVIGQCSRTSSCLRACAKGCSQQKQVYFEYLSDTSDCFYGSGA